MSQLTDGLWRLGELVELCSRLQTSGTGSSRRVRWEPNERLVRYYTSIGLLDRPAEMRGRTAYYGVRHLLQLLAVKAMQLQGYPLQEIQAALSGRSNCELEELAGLPENWSPDVSPTPGGEALVSSPPARAERFWERRPADLPRAGLAAGESSAGLVPDLPLQGLELAPGVFLLLDRRRYRELDPRQIRRLAAPLLEAIEQPGPKKEESE
ncbi:MAG: MerR family transcriptional regulator [Candidatus Eremiobacterota bacterium]